MFDESELSDMGTLPDWPVILQRQELSLAETLTPHRSKKASPHKGAQEQLGKVQRLAVSDPGDGGSEVRIEHSI